MSNAVRAFIAIELPGFIKTAIADVQKSLMRKIPGIRWTTPNHIHLTLAFLGDVLPEDITGICGVLSELAETVSPFELSVKGLGAFPGLGRPRVVWMGIGGEINRLQHLYRGLSEHLEIIGFAGEKRPFVGHLTLGRAKEHVHAIRLVDCVRGMKDFETRRFNVNEAALVKSELKPDGPIYTKLCSAEFTGAFESSKFNNQAFTA